MIRGKPHISPQPKGAWGVKRVRATPKKAHVIHSLDQECPKYLTLVVQVIYHAYSHKPHFRPPRGVRVRGGEELVRVVK